MKPAALFVLSFLLTGCAKYEYDITNPPELAGHIGTKADYTVHRDPLEYRLITVDNILVMRVFNPTDSSITLLGEKSFTVDPSGQSHPLQTQTMAPHSFIKLIIPPPRPYYIDHGPHFGIGVGTTVGSARYHHAAYGWSGFDDFYDGPQYLTVYDGDQMYWDWKGETEIRLLLVFQEGDRTFSHEFRITRKKM